MRIPIAPLLYTLSALIACQPDAPEITASAVAPRTAPQPAAAAPPAPPLAVKAPAWRWTHFGDEAIRRGAHKPAILLGEEMIALRGSDETRRTFSVERRRRDAAPGVVSAGEARLRWSFVVEDAPFVGDGALVAAGDTVVVALYSRIASGCRLVGLDIKTGAKRWEVVLEGLGPVSHSKYRNDVQVSVINGQVVVYGWESSGRYIEIVDPKSGRTLHNEQVSPRWSGWSDWGWIEEDDEADVYRAKLIGASTPGGATLLPLLNTWQVDYESGLRRWSVQLSPRPMSEASIAPSDDAQQTLGVPTAVAEAGGVVGVLYQVSGRSSGMIVGLNAQDGTPRWKTHDLAAPWILERLPGGVVSFDSQDDYFVVTCRDLFGNYVEILDAKSGEGVWRERWLD
jgi:hypothetical protein